jgi:hypothetical protein
MGGGGMNSRPCPARDAAESHGRARSALASAAAGCCPSMRNGCRRARSRKYGNMGG